MHKQQFLWKWVLLYDQILYVYIYIKKNNTQTYKRLNYYNTSIYFHQKDDVRLLEAAPERKSAAYLWWSDAEEPLISPTDSLELLLHTKKFPPHNMVLMILLSSYMFNLGFLHADL